MYYVKNIETLTSDDGLNDSRESHLTSLNINIISIDRRYRIMYMSYLRLRHVTRIAAMRLGCILIC